MKSFSDLTEQEINEALPNYGDNDEADVDDEYEGDDEPVTDLLGNIIEE